MFSSKSILLLSVTIFFHKVSANDQLTSAQQCQLRCLANCVSKDQQFSSCLQQCDEYGQSNFCNNGTCWQSCKGLSESSPNRNIPNDIRYSFTPSSAVNISWNPFPDSIYIMQYTVTDNFSLHYETVIPQPYLLNWSKNVGSFCDSVLIRLASASATGVSQFSEAYVIEAPIPQMSAALNVLSMTYINEPYHDSGYSSNGTIKLVLKFEKTEWPLGVADLIIEPLFFMHRCEIPDFATAVPNPHFLPGVVPYTIESTFGADYMYRKCVFLYTISTAHSKQCDTTLHFDESFDVMNTLKIDCSNVANSPCPETPKRHPPPLCGQVEGFDYDLLNVAIHGSELTTDASVNVTFRSTINPSKKPLYFIAFYGHARPFERQIDLDLLGVDMIDILGNSTNCPRFNRNGTCAEELNSVNVSLTISDLKLDTLYGVMICAVMDAKNLTFPAVNGVSQGMKSKANRVYIDASEDENSRMGLIIGIICGVMTVIFFIIIVVFFIIHRKQRQKMRMNQFKLQQLRLVKEQRYTDFPKRQDLWELERRNLVIYDDKKLGSGAFGAVYKGRLIGVAKGYKDAQSTLGVNLMRAENCDVAVKMLPEYADQISKSEFLKEISLMKTLGYHERLLNMLACITETEPYCLIVEYCSDGDLLHFLRERCKYMLKLTDMGIDYDNPTSEADFDIDMIITLKQLLMFAVQISYGLEYLSQKGFVHRDVAARNVMVHEKMNAKIGDFGLCRYIYAESANYKGKGGRLPVKWMSPEAIKHYEFTTKSDVWSFGILMFEIITLGGSPYPGIQPDDMMEHLEAGKRMEQPDNCPDNYYEVMKCCWAEDPAQRPDFGTIRQRLACQLEDVTDEYSYLKLDSQRDYYNVPYGGTTIKEPETLSNLASEEGPALKELNEVELANLEDIPLSSPLDDTKELNSPKNYSCICEGAETCCCKAGELSVAPSLRQDQQIRDGQVNEGFVQ